MPHWARRLVCRVLGHDTWSYSVRICSESMAHIERLGVTVCDRCGDEQFTVNKL